MNSLLALFQPQANAAATVAANAAVNDLACKPFNVVVSVSQDTQAFILVLLAAGILAAKFK